MSVNDTDALGKQDPLSLWVNDPKNKRDFFEEHRQFRQDLYIRESINKKFVETSWLSCECCYGMNSPHAEEHINAVLERIGERMIK